MSKQPSSAPKRTALSQQSRRAIIPFRRDEIQESDVLRGRAVFYTFKLYISLGVTPDAGTSPDTEGEGVRDP